MKVAIVDSGVANLASVESAFRSLDVPFSRASKPAELEAATHIVLPERLDTASAPSVLADLRLYRDHDVCLDFKNVTMLGTQCLQVLLNACHHWKVSGTPHAVQ